MESNEAIVHALRQMLPDTQQSLALPLARYLAAVAELGGISGLQASLAALRGQELAVGQMAISFGQAQTGDIQIRDVVGGNLTTINITAGAPPAFNPYAVTEPKVRLLRLLAAKATANRMGRIESAELARELGLPEYKAVAQVELLRKEKYLDMPGPYVGLGKLIVYHISAEGEELLDAYEHS